MQLGKLNCVMKNVVNKSVFRQSKPMILPIHEKLNKSISLKFKMVPHFKVPVYLLPNHAAVKRNQNCFELSLSMKRPVV